MPLEVQEKAQPLSAADLAAKPKRQNPLWLYAFWALAALQLIPIWSVRYFPSQDGPAHVDSAATILRYVEHVDPLVRHYYVFNPRLVPNWICHATMAAMMSLLPPIAAEKIILSLYVLLLPAGVYYLLRAMVRGAAAAAMLALPLVYNYPFEMGFYNFSIGLAICFFAIGYWLRCRDRFTYRDSAVLAGLTLLLYLSHLFCLLIAGGVIFALALLPPEEKAALSGRWTTMRQRWLGTFFAFAPAIALIVAVSIVPRVTARLSRPDHASAVAASGFKTTTPPELSARPLVEYSPRLPPALAGNLPAPTKVGLLGSFRHLRIDALIAHGGGETLAARAMFWIFVAGFTFLLISKIIRRDWNRSDVWLVLAGSMALLTIVDLLNIPMFFGLYISQRLDLFFFLMLVVWFATQDWQPRLRGAIAACAAAMTLALIAIHVMQYHRLNTDIDEFLSAAPHIQERSTLLPLCFAANGKAAGGEPQSPRIKFLGGSAAGGYLSAERQLVNLSNYEADRDHFPILFRPEVNPFDYVFRSDGIDLLTYQRMTDARIDYVLLWDVAAAPAELARRIDQQLSEGYKLIFTSSRGHVRLYRREAPAAGAR